MTCESTLLKDSNESFNHKLMPILPWSMHIEKYASSPLLSFAISVFLEILGSLEFNANDIFLM